MKPICRLVTVVAVVATALPASGTSLLQLAPSGSTQQDFDEYKTTKLILQEQRRAKEDKKGAYHPRTQVISIPFKPENPDHSLAALCVAATLDVTKRGLKAENCPAPFTDIPLQEYHNLRVDGSTEFIAESVRALLDHVDFEAGKEIDNLSRLLENARDSYKDPKTSLITGASDSSPVSVDTKDAADYLFFADRVKKRNQVDHLRESLQKNALGHLLDEQNNCAFFAYYDVDHAKGAKIEKKRLLVKLSVYARYLETKALHVGDGEIRLHRTQKRLEQQLSDTIQVSAAEALNEIVALANYTDDADSEHTNRMYH